MLLPCRASLVSVAALLSYWAVKTVPSLRVRTGGSHVTQKEGLEESGLVRSLGVRRAVDVSPPSDVINMLSPIQYKDTMVERGVVQSRAAHCVVVM